jgi:hypothetical protein
MGRAFGMPHESLFSIAKPCVRRVFASETKTFVTALEEDYAKQKC